MTRSLQGEEKKACSRRLGKRSGTPRIEDDSFDVQLSQAADAGKYNRMLSFPLARNDVVSV